MAVLGVAAAGAAIGAGVSGAVTGAVSLTAVSAGWAVGSLVGQYFFGAGAVSSGQDTFREGSRLSDLIVRGGSYGADIPQVWGIYRVGGLIIWKTPLREEKVTTTTSTGGGGGGKGGKGSGGGSSHTETSYVYHGSWACLLAEGVCGVRKIWANSKLIYDASGAGAEGFAAPYITIYTGDRTQLPDSTIEAVKGVGNVPAYRGSCYIVFDDLPLEDFGNSLPNIEAEIYKIDSAVCTATGLQITDNAPYIGPMWYIRDDFLSYSGAIITTVDVRYVFFSSNRYQTYLTQRRQEPDGTDAGSSAEMYIGLQDNNASETNIRTLEGGRYLCYGKTAGQTYPNAGVWDVVQMKTYADLAGEVHGDVDIDSISAAIIYKTPDGSDRWWKVEQGVGPGEWQIRVFTLREDDGQGEPTGIYIESYATLPIVFPVGRSPSTTSTLGGFINSIGDMILYTPWPGAPAVGAYDIVIYEAILGAGAVTIGRWWPLNGFRKINAVEGALIGGCYFGYGSDVQQQNAYLFRLSDANGDGNAVVEGEDLTLSSAHDRDTPRMFNIGADHVLLTTVATGATQPFTTHIADGVSLAGPADMSSIIRDTCLRCGLSESEVDTSGVFGQILGFARTGQMTGRACISSSSDICAVDAVESGGRIRWQSVCDVDLSTGITIPEDDLSAHYAGDAAGDALTLNRVQELEIPRVIEVTFSDPAQDYDTGTHRAYNPIAGGEGVLSLAIPAAIDANDAKVVAQRYLDVMESERISGTFRIGIEHLQLEPGDVFHVEHGGLDYPMRMRSMGISPGGLLECEALVYDPAAFVQTAVADPASGPAIIPEVVDSDVILMDTPVLRLEDAPWNGIYAAGYEADPGFTGTWPGADLYHQAGVGWQLGTFWSEGMDATFGTIDTPLGGTAHPWNWDIANEIVVTMALGALSSFTDLDVQNGANQLAVGVNGRWEIVGFVNAEFLGGTQYRLTRFLRARRGTEQFVGTGVAGDRLIFLDTVGVRRVTLSEETIDVDMNWRLVPANSRIALAGDRPFVMRGVCLIPFAPVHIAGYRVDGDLRIEWTPRSRCSIEQLMGEDYGFCEVDDRFEIDLRLSGGTALLRTITVDDASSVVYSLEAFRADSGQGLAVAIPALDVTIYQMSAVVGRGYPGFAVG